MWSNYFCDFCSDGDISTVPCSVYGTLSILLKHLYSKACILLAVSAERVHASQSYKAVDVTMALRSLILVLKAMDLLLSNGCNFANAVVAMAILDFMSVSDLPSLVILAPKYLKEVTSVLFPLPSLQVSLPQFP